MKRLLFVSLIAVALIAASIAAAATVLKNPASPTKLAYAKKALSAPAGKITLVMSNPSALPHDIGVRNGTTAKSKVLKKGKIASKGGVSKVTVTLKKGRYRFFCSVPGHEAGGMWGILTVK